MVPARRPVLIVVAGWPATGKTTFARMLAARLGLPVFNKDTIKELLWDRLGEGDVDWSHRLGIAAFGALDSIAEIVLRAGQDVIVEGNFDPEHGMSLQTVIAATGADAFVVVVNAPSELIVERYRRRAETGERHPAHFDEALLPKIEQQVQDAYAPPPLRARRLDVDVFDDESASAALDEVAEALEVAFPKSS